MNKLIYYIALSVMCLLPVSCSLEEEISTEVEKENYLKTRVKRKTFYSVSISPT